MHCICNNIIIKKENHRFSTTFEVMQNQKEKQKMKHFSILCLLPVSKVHCAFPASCKHRQPGCWCYWLIGQILEIWSVVAVSQFILCGTKWVVPSFSLKYGIAHPETVDEFSLTVFRQQIDLSSRSAQKGLAKWESSSPPKRGHSCCMKCFLCEGGRRCCLCWWMPLTFSWGKNFCLPTTILCFLWSGRLQNKTVHKPFSSTELPLKKDAVSQPSLSYLFLFTIF